MSKKKNKIGVFGDLTNKAEISGIKAFGNGKAVLLVDVIKENKVTAHVRYGDEHFKIHKKKQKFHRVTEERAMKIIDDALVFAKTGKQPDPEPEPQEEGEKKDETTV